MKASVRQIIQFYLDLDPPPRTIPSWHTLPTNNHIIYNLYKSFTNNKNERMREPGNTLWLKVRKENTLLWVFMVRQRDVCR